MVGHSAAVHTRWPIRSRIATLRTCRKPANTSLRANTSSNSSRSFARISLDSLKTLIRNRAVYADVAVAGASPHPGYPTFADGHDEMLVGDAIAQSAREGRWVAVDRRPIATQQTAAQHEKVRTS